MEQLKNISFDHVKITGGFWHEKQRINRDVTIPSVYNQFANTGRIEAFEFTRREDDKKPHFFWDSDVAKWMEAAAYAIHIGQDPDKTLENQVDKLVDEIEKHQLPSGYFNIYFQQFEPDKIFTNRNMHELYCAGHLLEAAIAYYNATGKEKFLKLMEKYMDYIYQVFYVDKSASFCTPGHQEIELALMKLYRLRKDKRMLDLCSYFINERGKTDGNGAYSQSHAQPKDQREAVGHAVRALYMYSGMADLAYEGDEPLKTAVKALFDNVVNKKMYVTGCVGSTHIMESFAPQDYYLPNSTSYAETCGAIALALFSHRMSALEADSKYADTLERVIYNGAISGVSLKGDEFFYENVQELDHTEREFIKSYKDANSGLHLPISKRVKVFWCSCCPPNITRFIASVGNYLYTLGSDTVYVQQYMDSESEFENIKITQRTDYPVSGVVNISYKGDKKYLALRIPAWCDKYSVLLNGQKTECKTHNGYALIETQGECEVVLDMNMQPFFVEANPKLHDDCGRYAVQRGPVVYCMESVDNGEDLRDIKLGDNFSVGFDQELGVQVLYTDAVRRRSTDALYSRKKDNYEGFTAKLIPYYAFANRQDESDMLIWCQTK